MTSTEVFDALRGGRRLRFVAAAAAIVVLIAAAAVGALQVRRLAEPVGPAPTVRFTRLAPFGDGLPMSLSGPSPDGLGVDYAFVTVIGDRALVGHRDPDRRVRLQALDLTTGNPAWSSDAIGEWEEGPSILPSSGLALVLVNNDSDKHQEHQVYAFDPVTGRLLWHTDDFPLLGSTVDGQLLGFNGDGDTLVSLDERTGQRVWSQHLPNGSMIPRQPWGSRTTLRQTGDLLFWWGEDATVTAVDTRAGTTVRTWPGLLPQAGNDGGPVLGYGSLVFKVHNGLPNKVEVLDLALARDGFRTLYEPASAEFFPQVSPCGPRQVCVTTGAGGTDRTGHLAVIDVDTGDVRWRADTVDGEGAALWFADRIVAPGGSLFDLNGRRLYQPAKAASFELVTSGSALVIEGGQEIGIGATPEPEVLGLSIADGSTMSLGRIPTLAGNCSHNLRVMVCVHKDGLTAYRFAE